MLKDFKSLSLKPRAEKVCEAAVVHASAGKRDLLDACRGSRLNGCAHEGRGHGCMESSRDTRLAYT
jgi:hypothetical protein